MKNVKNAKTILWLPALVLIVAIAYQPAWHGGILWDDTGHLTRSGLRSSSGGDRAGFHNDLGVAFARLGRRDEAIQQVKG